MMSRYTESKSKSFSQNFVTNDVLLEPKINMGILAPALGYLGHYSEWKKLGPSPTDHGQVYTESNKKYSFTKIIFKEGLLKPKDHLKVKLYLF